MDTNQNLQQAVMMVKQGNREAALQIINRILEAEPLNERAWLGYAYAIPERQTGIQALLKVLEINPNNQAARRQLDLWMTPASGVSTPAPAAEASTPIPASNFAYTPIPDPVPPAPEIFPPASEPEKFNPLKLEEDYPPVPEPSVPAWLSQSLAPARAAPEKESVFGLYTGYQAKEPDPEPEPIPASASQSMRDNLFSDDQTEEPADPQIQLLSAIADTHEKSLEEQRKSFKYLVEYNNNLANVLNGTMRQMTDIRRQMANLFTGVIVLGGLVLVAVIILLVK